MPHPFFIGLFILGMLPVLFNGCAEFKSEDFNNIENSIGNRGLNKSPFTCNPEQKLSLQQSERLSAHQIKLELKSILPDSIYKEVNALINSLPKESIRGDISDYNGYASETLIQGVHKVAYEIYELLSTRLDQAVLIGDNCIQTEIANIDCQTQFIQQASRRILKRPFPSSSLEDYLGLFKQGTTPAEKAALIIATMIQSPYFIYYIKDRHLKNPQIEVARRLSFLLTDHGPDKELLRSAENGQLFGQNLKGQAYRLINSEAGRIKVVHAIKFWLDIREATQATFSEAFKSGTDVGELYSAASLELDQFIEHVVFTKKSGFEELLTSTDSLAKNPYLAEVYGHTPATESEPIRSLHSPRAGVLLRVPYLAYDDQVTHPIIRGIHDVRRILCSNVGDPDPEALLNAPDVSLVDFLESNNTRERTHMQTGSGSCASCHNIINPHGYAYESFDTMGRFRELEKVYSNNGDLIAQHNLNLNTEVRYLDFETDYTSITSGLEYVTAIAKSKKAAACFVRHTFRYYHLKKEAQTQEKNDSCLLSAMYKGLEARSIQDMIVNQAIISSNQEFVLRQPSSREFQ